MRDQIQSFAKIREASAVALEALTRSTPREETCFALICSQVTTTSTDCSGPLITFGIGVREDLYPDLGSSEEAPVYLLAVELVAPTVTPLARHSSGPISETADENIEPLEPRYTQIGHGRATDTLGSVETTALGETSGSDEATRGNINRSTGDRINQGRMYGLAKVHLNSTPNGYQCYTSSVRSEKFGKSRGTPVTLQHLLTDLGKRQRKRMTYLETLQLARILSSVVLKYFSTPWLPDSWRSSDVCFLDRPWSARDGLPDTSPPPPFILRCAQDRTRLPPSENHAPNCLEANQLLYGLGTMLLEIAHSTPIEDLVKADSLGRPTGCGAEYIAVRNMARLVSRVMGSRYQRVTEKCIGCHFAAGSDLASEQLQLEFYRDVVQELEDIEEGMHRLER